MEKNDLCNAKLHQHRSEADGLAKHFSEAVFQYSWFGVLIIKTILDSWM